MRGPSAIAIAVAVAATSDWSAVERLADRIGSGAGGDRLGARRSVLAGYVAQELGKLAEGLAMATANDRRSTVPRHVTT